MLLPAITELFFALLGPESSESDSILASVLNCIAFVVYTVPRIS